MREVAVGIDRIIAAVHVQLPVLTAAGGRPQILERVWRVAEARPTVTDMTSGPDLTQRVTRLENDVEAVYEILTDLQSTQSDHTRTLDEHTRILDEHTRILDEHTRRLDSIDSTLVEHSGRFDRIDGTLEEILRRLPEPS